MDVKIKSGNPYGELPEPKPKIHKGYVMKVPIVASEVWRNGKMIRENGIPVEEGE